MVQHPERVLLHIVEYDAPLRVRHVYDVFLRCARLAIFESVHHPLWKLAERIILCRIVEKRGLGAGGKAIVPTVHQPAVRVGAVAARGVNTAAHIAIHPRSDLVEGRERGSMIRRRLRNSRRLPAGFSQHHAP